MKGNSHLAESLGRFLRVIDAPCRRSVSTMVRRPMNGQSIVPSGHLCLREKTSPPGPIEDEVPVQGVSYDKLRKRLLEDQRILSR